ncbi:MAG: PAS domain S-box protein [Nitrospirota bacterium]
MSLRLKLLFMLSTFLVVILIFAAGTLLIFQKMSDSMGALYSASEEHRLVEELEKNFSDFIKVTRNWGFTGDVDFKKQYHIRLASVYKSFGDISAVLKDKEDLDVIGSEFQQILGYSKVVIENRYPVGDPQTLDYLQRIDVKGKEILDRITALHGHYVNVVMNVAGTGEEMKRNMIYYLLLLIVFSSIMSVFLIISIRRTIADPFNELLKATERISMGELSYRIKMGRKDEFGIVADRFDNMVSELETSTLKINRKLDETELFLDVARIAGSTPELREALFLITDKIAKKLNYDNCVIYMLKPEMKVFCLDASSMGSDGMKESCLSVEAGVAKEVVSSLSSVMIESTGSFEGDDLKLIDDYTSVLTVPIIRDNAVSGLLVVRNKSQHVFSDDEINILKILAHTIGSAVRNTELFLSTKKQLQKLTVLYELSKAVTSILDLDELLKRIAEEISRLLSSKGCIIRLLENNRLKIKSYFGIQKGVEDEMELRLGEGIAGWVAEKGTPLLVEDVSRMPANLRVPVIDVKSVICVPLKVGTEVIGTLGLYDKYDIDGALVPYSVDDLNTAEGFASIFAIAIEKSKAFENEVIREKKASEERKRLNILFDSVQGGIITLDRDYNITSANKYVEDWVSMSGEQLIGQNALDIFHDKIGICPHCAARATFDTGEINAIMQSRGVNYAELTAYPIKSPAGEILESVVFIMDITERVLYQEETLSLYREVIQTKEYLESIINNSADAIVISDTEGIITSWNKSAERIFGFSESEAIGKFLPFVPDFLLEKEKQNIEELKKGGVLKDIETLRKRKDGTIIEVSLTLSPIKDAAGEVIGISGISRDISEKKAVEKELVRRNQELSRLFFISSAMRSTLELDRLLRMVLTAVTMSDGMGFNRAILFLVDEDKNVLKGAMGVGPASPEEAWKIWDDLSLKQQTLDNIMQDIATSPVKKDSFFDKLTHGIIIPLESDTILTRAVKEKKTFNIMDVRDEALSDAILIQQLGTQAYAAVPMISRDKVIGLIWVDNYFNRKPITEEDMKFLTSFSNQVASAIENARLFEQVNMAEQQLENIFESMSDMVYFNSSEYVIKSINKAVSKKLGLSPSEIIGKKCYEVFHGMNEPFKKCPHHKTVVTKKAYIEELEDPHLGGTFLTSSSPIFDSAGEFIGSVHVVRDVTELKNLREKLVSAEKMAALGEVAAKVAHEIRNPLVSVGGFATRLEKKLDGNLKEYAGIIVKEVERLEEILKEILGFVKEVRLAKEKVDINSLVDEVTTLMKSDIEDRGIALVKDFSKLAEVFIDPNRVKEAIVNILSNAIQSITGSGSIHIKTYAKEEYAVVEIADTGRGISESDISFIFDPFFTTKSAGTGLGLAITNKIIQEHNGRIEVESKIDRGSIFRVYIPIKEE